MRKIILLDKKEGETPLEALQAFRKKNPEYRDLPMTYAGRLDPLASGLLLILAGEKVKEKEKYLDLPKEYEFSVLFGFATDTFDILGKITKQGAGKISAEDIKNNLSAFKGSFLQKYPPYSSKTLKKVRSGEKTEQLEHAVNVKRLEPMRMRKIQANALLKNIERRISKVKGDFRQEEILRMWRENLSKGEYQLVSFSIGCGSGTYVRAIADDLGEKMGVPALAFSIRRTRIGKWCKM